LSRSAFICRAIESTRSRGGLMSLISMRVTLTPQGVVASRRRQQPGVIWSLRQQLVEVISP